jgi:hypothetical protein
MLTFSPLLRFVSAQGKVFYPGTSLQERTCASSLDVFGRHCAASFYFSACGCLIRSYKATT